MQNHVVFLFQEIFSYEQIHLANCSWRAANEFSEALQGVVHDGGDEDLAPGERKDREMHGFCESR